LTAFRSKSGSGFYTKILANADSGSDAFYNTKFEPYEKFNFNTFSERLGSIESFSPGYSDSGSNTRFRADYDS
jgi:hypothetical protein